MGRTHAGDRKSKSFRERLKRLASIKAGILAKQNGQHKRNLKARLLNNAHRRQQTMHGRKKSMDVVSTPANVSHTLQTVATEQAGATTVQGTMPSHAHRSGSTTQPPLPPAQSAAQILWNKATQWNDHKKVLLDSQRSMAAVLVSKESVVVIPLESLANRTNILEAMGSSRVNHVAAGCIRGKFSNRSFQRMQYQRDDGSFEEAFVLLEPKPLVGVCVSSELRDVIINGVGFMRLCVAFKVL